MTRSRIAIMAAVAGTSLLAACSDSGTGPAGFAAPVAHISQGCPTAPIQGQVQLCVDGSDATFIVTSPGSNDTIPLVNDDFTTVLSNGGANKTAAAVLYTTPSGTVTDSIVVFQGRARLRTDPLTVIKTLTTGAIRASAFAGRESGAMIVFYNH